MGGLPYKRPPSSQMETPPWTETTPWTETPPDRQTSVKQECIPVGCIPSATVAVCWGVHLPRGVYLPGECICLGVYLPEGVFVPAGGYLPGVNLPAQGGVPAWAGTPQGAGTPPPVNTMTDRQVYKHNLRNFVADGKHNLRKLRLRAVKMSNNTRNVMLPCMRWSFSSSIYLTLCIRTFVSTTTKSCYKILCI